MVMQMKFVAKTKELTRKVNMKAMLGVAIVAGVLNKVAQEVGFAGYCEINANTTTNNFMKALFNVLMFAGIILFLAGAVTLIRTVVSMASGEQAQPGAIGKGIGLLIGGVVLVASKAIVSAMLGTDPTSLSIF